MKLLTDSNPKLAKGESKGYLSFILHLAPASLSGHNVCPSSSEECRKLCLNTAGRGRFTRTQEARIRKTKLFFEDRWTFLRDLHSDMWAGVRKAKRLGLIPVFRLNGTSDIRWEVIFPELFVDFRDYQFYDYTKLSNRRNLPDNYHLTFSESETNGDKVVTAFENGMNVATVFHTVPEEYNGRIVINGDEHDLRFLDPKGVYVGLKAKGLAKKSMGEFVK